MLLDDGVLEQQRVGFMLHHHPANVAHLACEHSCFAVFVLLFVEVAGHAVFEVLGLAYIQDGPFFVKELVHPGFAGHAFKDGFDGFVPGHA